MGERIVTMTIGIFDSGLGGLTVARAIMEILPREQIIYFGDTARTPYGDKSPELVAQYALENTQFLLRKKIDLLVVGCNTASAIAGDTLRKEFPAVPIFEVITPAVREALRQTRSGKIGLIGTRNTISSGAYQQWLPGCVVKACPLLVPLVESGRIMHPATYEVAEQYLTPLKRALVDTLILGCTHYPFLKPVIADIMGSGVRLVDSAETVAKAVVESLKHESMKALKQKSVPKPEFYVSKKTPQFQELAEKWLGQKINLQLAANLY